MENRFERIMNDVFSEIKRQDDKWGPNRQKHPLEWQCILLEEVGEVAKELCDNSFSKENLKQNYRTELIQVISVGMQALLNYDNDLIMDADFEDPEPTIEQFGFQSSNIFDQESGWTIEGGEEAFFKAHGKWVQRNTLEANGFSFETGV